MAHAILMRSVVQSSGKDPSFRVLVARTMETAARLHYPMIVSPGTARVSRTTPPVVLPNLTGFSTAKP